jgi:hypothetical protein
MKSINHGENIVKVLIREGFEIERISYVQKFIDFINRRNLQRVMCESVRPSHMFITDETKQKEHSCDGKYYISIRQRSKTVRIDEDLAVDFLLSVGNESIIERAGVFYLIIWSDIVCKRKMNEIKNCHTSEILYIDKSDLSIWSKIDLWLNEDVIDEIKCFEILNELYYVNSLITSNQ